MKTLRFHEYMNSKGKIDAPVVKLDGDRLDQNNPPNTPPQGGKPYAVKDGKSKKSSKGFADQGDEGLKYNPKIDNDNKGKAPAKIPTVDEMALAAKVVTAVAKDPTIVESIVRQLKNNGLLGVLVAEMLNHNETYNQISEVMSHKQYGPDLCKKLVRAMNEEVSPPFSDQLDMDDEEDPDAEDMEDMEGDEFGLDGEDSDDIDGLDDLDGLEDSDGLEDDMDPDMMDPNADPSMDPSMGQMDPNMMDPNDPSMGQMDPNMMQQMMQQNPAMMNFQRAMMRAYMRKHMGKA